MAKNGFTALDQQKKKMFIKALVEYRGIITSAAKEVGITADTAHRWIKKFKLRDTIENLKEQRRSGRRSTKIHDRDDDEFDQDYDDDEIEIIELD